MSIDKNLWQKPFYKNKFPTWTCSTCGVGLLELQKNTLNFEESGESLAAKSHDAWDPEWLFYRFSALLKCNNQNCGDCSVITGRGEVIEVHYQDHNNVYEQQWVERFYPEYINPPPQIFPIPSKTPDEIRDEILASFSIFLLEPNAAGNRIRTSIETLLTHQKINKIKVIRGKRRRLSLHERIQAFQTKHQEISDNLLAIKWIGNAASHTTGLKTDDIFDAYEIMHHVLIELYEKRSARIKKLTTAINKRKGTLSK